MDCAVYQKVKELFGQAIQLPREERASWLAEVCADGALREQVERLLVAHEEADDTLEGSVNQMMSDAVRDRELAALDRELGHAFEPLDILGEGGMGKVYLVAQHEPIRRKVALKLIRGGIENESVLARFEAERQALARMTHPCIATIYDAGLTSKGRPYFAMEYVEGIRITDWCDQHDADLDSRLNLFIGVCHGVQHAHQKGVIHRDIKPSNVLVTDKDEKPEPKIIDFGIAHPTEGRLSPNSFSTLEGNLPGTPRFMSPEQISDKGVDTRSDVYALGVLLYRLMTGRLPFTASQPVMLMYQIVKEAPPAPSSVSEPTGMPAHKLQGDLDAIILKALAKQPDDRYQSPAELAADLVRFQQHFPLQAIEGGTLYRWRCWVRRHRRATLAGLLLLVSLVLGVSGTLVGMLRARKAMVVANIEAQKARSSSAFLQEMLHAPNLRADGREVKVVDVLDRAANDLWLNFKGDPSVAASLHQTLGKSYLELGVFDRAEHHLLQAVLFYQSLQPLDAEALLHAQDELGECYLLQGRFDEAAVLLRELLQQSLILLGGEHSRTSSIRNSLAMILESEGAYEEAQCLLLDAIAVEEHHPDRNFSTLLTLRMTYAHVIRGLQGPAAAVPYWRQVLDVQECLLGERHPDTLTSMYELSHLLRRTQQLDEAEALLRRELKLSAEVFGPDHPDLLTSMQGLAQILYARGRYDEAERLALQVLAHRRGQLGDEHPFTAYAYCDLGFIYLARDQGQRAQAYFEHAIVSASNEYEPEHPDLLYFRTSRAQAIANQGRIDDALAEIDDCLAISSKVRGVDHPDTIKMRELRRKIAGKE